MSGLVNVWKESSITKRFGLIAISGAVIGGAAFGVYKLKAKGKPQSPPPTPTKHVEPYEDVSKTPKTPPPSPKTPPPVPPKPKFPKAPTAKEEDTQKTTEQALTEYTLSKDYRSSSMQDSFEPLSISHTSPSSSTVHVPSLPPVHFNPSLDLQSGDSISAVSDSSSSMSFVRISPPSSMVAPEEVLTASESMSAYCALPGDKPIAQTGDGDKTSKDWASVSSATRDSVSVYPQPSNEDEEEVILGRDDDEMSRDGTTLATVGSDTEYAVEEEEYSEDFEKDSMEQESEEEELSEEEYRIEERIQRDVEKEEEFGKTDEKEEDIPEEFNEVQDSGDVDIQRIEEEDSSASAQPQSQVTSAANNQVLKEKDENDIIVISQTEHEK